MLQLPEKNADAIKALLIEQIYSTVKWRETLINMFNNGISKICRDWTR